MTCIKMADGTTETRWSSARWLLSVVAMFYVIHQRQANALDSNPSAVLEKIARTYPGEEHAEARARLMFVLGQETSDQNTRYFQILEFSLNDESTFRLICDKIITENRNTDDGEFFEDTMNTMSEMILTHSNEMADDGKGWKTYTAIHGIAFLLAATPHTYKYAMEMSIVHVAKAFCAGGSTQLAIAAQPHIAAIHMVWEVYQNVKLWWNGEISGKRCAKNVFDHSFSVYTGYVTGSAGVAIGSVLMPGIGSLVGGIVGGMIGYEVAKMLIDILTRDIFDLPKTVALEKAYNFLRLRPTASNDEVNKQYKILALLYHPDRPGGSHEEFSQLQSYVGIIKAARENKD